MFSFDRWADWLQLETHRLIGEGLACRFTDLRGVPEVELNPSFSLEVESHARLGRISFWERGTCDFEVLDPRTSEYLADEAMLEANDETVPVLVTRFLSLLED